MNKIKYVVACYMGFRRADGIKVAMSPFVYLEEHIKFLSQYDISDAISEAVFVINGGDLELDKLDITSIKIPIKFIDRENIDFSYGAWNHVVEDDIKNNKVSDYYFLLEDDYIPIQKDFYKNFIKLINNNVAYVAQLMFETDASLVKGIHNQLDSSIVVPQYHAAISNGMLNGKICSKIYNKFNSVFRLNGLNDYGFAEFNQVLFLEYFNQMGYNLLDITEYHHSIFLTNSKDKVIYGDENLPLVIKPIY